MKIDDYDDDDDGERVFSHFNAQQRFRGEMNDVKLTSATAYILRSGRVEARYRELAVYAHFSRPGIIER